MKIISFENKIQKKKEGIYIDIEEQRKFINLLYLKTETFKESKLFDKELNKKMQSYKQQDKNKNRFNAELIIKKDEILEKLVISKLKCYYCKCDVNIIYTNVKQPNSWTLDRLDNSLGHYNSNTVICCLKCNLQKRKREPEGFKFLKQLIIKKI